MFKKDMIFCEKIKGKKMEQKKIHYKRRIAVIAVSPCRFCRQLHVSHYDKSHIAV